ncbi:hypothetical protein PMAYCL1PPCAC_00190, partial [Pristionchus mayeri]
SHHVEVDGIVAEMGQPRTIGGSLSGIYAVDAWRRCFRGDHISDSTARFSIVAHASCHRTRSIQARPDLLLASLRRDGAENTNDEEKDGSSHY